MTEKKNDALVPLIPEPLDRLGALSRSDKLKAPSLPRGWSKRRATKIHGSVILGTALLGALTGLRASTPIPVLRADLPLLFADDGGVATRTGVVRTVHRARTHAAPAIQPDQPWEGSRVYIYGSVYQDPAGGEFRMWYMSRPGNEISGRSDARDGKAPSLRTNGFDLTLYATSRDGLRWEKPPLGLHEFDGASANNIAADLHSPSVLRDEAETDIAKRYKMLGYLVAPYSAYHASFSSDGIHWQSYPESSVLKHGDTITLTKNPATGEYLAYHKRPARVRGFDRRVVWLSRSLNFQDWSEPELVFAADEIDDAWTRRPHERTEVYNMSVFPHAGGFIGLPAIFRVMTVRSRDEIGPAQSPLDGPIDIQLAASTDGRTWQRSWPRIDIIPRGAPGTFDGGTILGVASVPVHTDKETWVYYTAINTGHGGPMPPKRITIGRADWRLHGFASLDASPTGGRVETIPLRLAAPHLVINADASRGELRVALLEADGLPVAGCSLEGCEPLRGDDTHWIARWPGQQAVPLNRPVRVVVEMTSTRLYSLAAGR